MSSIDRLAQLNALHLYGMATAWSELLAEGPRRPSQPELWIDRLIEAELAVPGLRRRVALPPDQPALRKDLADRHHQFVFFRMGDGV